MCNIEVTGIVGLATNASNVATIVSVTGIVDECSADPVDGGQVFVELECGGNTSGLNAQVVGNLWFAVFREVNCRCDELVIATATCVTDPACSSTLTINPDEQLWCIDCPTIEFITSGIEDDVEQIITEIECQSDNSANVIFQYEFTNNTQETIFVDVYSEGDVVSHEEFPPGNSQTITVTCNYPTPKPTPEIIVWLLDEQSRPIGCPPIIKQLPSVETCCPKLAGAVKVEIDGCVATFSSDLDVSGCDIHWDFGYKSKDGEQVVLDIKDTLNRTHTFPAIDTYSVSVGITCQKCTDSTGITVEITDCSEPPPPDDDDDDGNGGGGDGDNGGSGWGWVFCAFLFWTAMSNTVGAVALLISWGCDNFMPLLPKGGWAAALVGLALGFLLLWGALCKKFFSCKFLCQTKNAVKIMMIITPALGAIAGWLNGNTFNYSCLLGAAAALAHLGVVLLILDEIEDDKKCDCDGLF